MNYDVYIYALNEIMMYVLQCMNEDVWIIVLYLTWTLLYPIRLRFTKGWLY